MYLVHVFVVAIFAQIATAQVNPYADCCDSYCYKEDENPYLLMGTKTAYEFVYGKSSNQHIVPYCRPIQIWSFNRHGTRYPSRESIQMLETLQKLKENIIKNYDTRRSYPETGRLCDRDLDGFRRWNWNTSITQNTAHEITQQGRDDMTFLARRFQTRYPELLRLPYSNQHYEFQYTNTDRTRSSYEAFAQGLFGQDAYRSQAQPQMNDNITRGYKHCNAWLQNVKNNPDTLFEVEKFKEKDEYKRVIAHVSRRLGFRYTLNETIVKTMYDMCRYEKSWYVRPVSIWCAAFTKDNLKVLEYAEDLKYYYTAGYGTEMNNKLGCPAVKDLMDRFERTVQAEGRNLQEPRVVVHFTHTEALQLLMVALGIYKDSQPLTADNMRIQQRRLWRTSINNPFSANLVAVLYQCNNNEQYQVMFFLNEKPVDFPGCQVGLCSWKYLKEQLHGVAANCDLDFCDHAAAMQNYAYPLLVLALILTVFHSNRV